MIKIELTKKELENVIYHLNYDIETITTNHDFEEIGLKRDDSLNALKKLQEANK